MTVKKLIKELKKVDKKLKVRIVLLGGEDPIYYDKFLIEDVSIFECIEITITRSIK